MDKTIEHICLMFAMQAEAEPVVRLLALQKKFHTWADELPVNVYEGQLSGVQISCIVNGLDPRHQVDLIGPVPATLSAGLVCTQVRPDVIISCGTAGLLSNDPQEIGQIYFSDGPCIFHDRRVPLAGFESSAIGHYDVLNVSALAKRLNAKTGKLSSGSSLALDPRELEVMKTHNAVLKEMEGAAIAWTASIYNVPFFAIKAVTNVLLATSSSEAQFEKNFALAVESLSVTVNQTLAQMAGQSLGQLA